MTNDETVSNESTEGHTAGRDLAPTPPAKKLAAAAEDIGVIAENAPEKFDLSKFKNPNTAEKRKTTFGEKAHWAMTYIGGDWILNSAVGVTFTFLTSRTPWAERWFIPKTDKIFGSVLKKFFKDPVRDEKILKGAISGCRDFISIMVGGTVINPILTKLESHEQKKSISKFFDTLRYGKEKVENDPKFQQAYNEIDHEPVKDTSSVWYSRFIALAPLLVLATVGSTRKFMESTDTPVIKYFTFDNIAKHTKKAAEAIGIKPKGMMLQQVEDESRKIKITRWESLHNIIGFDYGLTIFYAFLHAATFAAVARFRDNNRIKKVEKETNKIDTSLENHEQREKETVLLPYDDTPNPRVSHVAHHDAVQLQQGAPQLG